MKSSREVLELLTNNLLYLDVITHDSIDDAVIQDCIKQVGDLEEIINELIGETVQLNKRIG